MDKELKSRWVEALESGKYKQGKGFLRDINDNHCCLGVLCDIISKEGNPNCGWDNNCQFRYGNTVRGSCLTEEMSNDFGIHWMVCDRLMLMNDTHNYSFKTIARWIKDNL